MAPFSRNDSTKRASQNGRMKAETERPVASTCQAETRCPSGTRPASRVPAKPTLARSSRNRMILAGIMTRGFSWWCSGYFTLGHRVHHDQRAGPGHIRDSLQSRNGCSSQGTMPTSSRASRRSVPSSELATGAWRVQTSRRTSHAFTTEGFAVVARDARAGHSGGDHGSRRRRLADRQHCRIEGGRGDPVGRGGRIAYEMDAERGARSLADGDGHHVARRLGDTPRTLDPVGLSRLLPAL